jgi:hypothetical protein
MGEWSFLPSESEAFWLADQHETGFGAIGIGQKIRGPMKLQKSETTAIASRLVKGKMFKRKMCECGRINMIMYCRAEMTINSESNDVIIFKLLLGSLQRCTFEFIGFKFL